MKTDKWTQQLHDKLAEHETAAPEGLWADIEAALAQQPKAAPLRPRSRFVALRRWAVAASIAALLIGGGYLWWNMQPLPEPQGKEQGKGTDTYSDLAQVSDEIIMQPPPLTPPLEDQGVDVPRIAVAHSAVALADEEKTTESTETVRPTEDDTKEKEPQHQIAEQPQRQIAEQPQRQISENPQRQIAENPQRQTAEWPHRQATEKPAVKPKRQVSLNLYAMNGLDNQNSSNGVQMADALAEQYMNTYANSYTASARSSEPIYLTGYEERQHHQRPITYGLTLSYPLSGRLSLTSGVVYTKLQSDFTQIMGNQQIQQEQTLHYVGIPLNLNYKLWAYKSLRTYLAAGVRADWNVKTHLETEGAFQHLPKDRMQWSLNGSLGLQYDILPQMGLYVEPSLNWYPDNGSNIQNYFKDKPLSLGLQVGLRLNMK